MKPVATSMQIPTSFKLGAHTWRVRISDTLGVSQNLYGLCDYEANLIRIARNVNGKALSQQSMFQTFLHEFIHAALHILGKNDDEEFVAGMEQMWFQLYKTAKYGKSNAPAHGKAS
jgi:hypothetical protein